MSVCSGRSGEGNKLGQFWSWTEGKNDSAHTVSVCVCVCVSCTDSAAVINLLKSAVRVQCLKGNSTNFTLQGLSTGVGVLLHMRSQRSVGSHDSKFEKKSGVWRSELITPL